MNASGSVQTRRLRFMSLEGKSYWRKKRRRASCGSGLGAARGAFANWAFARQMNSYETSGDDDWRMAARATSWHARLRGRSAGCPTPSERLYLFLLLLFAIPQIPRQNPAAERAIV